MANTYLTVLRAPGAARFAFAGFVGRMPMSMMTIAVLLLVRSETGSYAIAGVASAATTLTHAAASPVVGRLADRRGQAAVVPTLLLLFLAGIAVLEVGAIVDAPTAVLLLGAVVAGLGQVPYSSLVRSRWAHLLAGDEKRLTTALALESIADEAIFVAGPVLVTALAVVDPLLGPLAAAALSTIGTIVFVGATATAPPFSATRRGPAAWRFLGLWVLVGGSLMLGIVFGSLEVSMIAFAQERDAPGLAGVLLGLIAFGSALAGLWYGAREWQMALPRRYQLSLGALGVVCLPAVAVSTLPWMVPASLLIGLFVAPTLIAANGLIARIMPSAARTEGFSWASAAINVGAGTGAALGGWLVEVYGPSAGFWICPVAALLGAGIAVLGSARLVPVDAEAPEPRVLPATS